MQKRGCIICGRTLGPGRKRYCSKCKPTGKRKPFIQELSFKDQVEFWKDRLTEIDAEKEDDDYNNIFEENDNQSDEY
jgi:hypothetical protein